MRLRNPALFGIALAGFLLTASCGLSPGIATVATDPMNALPPDSRHVFVPADPKWTRVVKWLAPMYADGKLNGYTVLDADPHKPAYPREELYYDSPKTDNMNDPEASRKRLRINPDGKITLEIDRQRDKKWMREFRADGSVSTYRYYSAPETLWAAYSTRGDGKATSLLANGFGTFIDWSPGGKTCTRCVVRGGKWLFAAEFNSRECTAIGLTNANADSLQRRKNSESLSLLSRAEFWNFEGGKAAGTLTTIVDPVLEKRTLPADELHDKLRQYGDSSYQTFLRAHGNPVILEDYFLRRAEFVLQFSGLLESSGDSWASLGLAALRDDPTAPLPEPDPSWFPAGFETK